MGDDLSRVDEGQSLFTDVSVDPKLKFGVGAYLVVPISFLKTLPSAAAMSEMAERLVTRAFEAASSTTLEVQTALWALEVYRDKFGVPGPGRLKVYSDSQCVVGLLGRRPGLEKNGFVSKGTNRPLRNASLYRRFFELHDELGFEVIKVAGHARSSPRETVQWIFSCVDKAVRKAFKARGLEVWSES